jgi:phosphate transport system permease protein
MRDFFRSGDPFIWLAGSALSFCLLMIAGLVVVVVTNGLGFFWPKDLVQVDLTSGQSFYGEIVDRQEIPADQSDDGQTHWRIQLKIGNRDAYGLDFRWIDEADIESRSTPKEAAVFERLEWGNAHGVLAAIVTGSDTLARGPGAWAVLDSLQEVTGDLTDRIHDLERGEMGAVNAQIEALRLERRTLERAGDADPAELARLDAEQDRLWTQYDGLSAQLVELRQRSERFLAIVELPDGSRRSNSVAHIVRAYQPNGLSTPGKAGVYLAKFWEFLSGEPRESNTEGGIFPALFGTVMMVILMTLFAVPFGVLAALYLREYAKQGPLVRAIRIAVNNLAGVPSIVFGMFGLGFFVYGVGGTIDLLFYPERLPTPTYGTGGILWASMTLALLTLPVVIVATEEALAAVPAGIRDGSLALGSTKLQMIWRVVLPSALPGILTGVILATARGAGEVAPLMITGVVKLAPDLPLDGIFPFLHLERKFMHLGFHIYDVGFQSPNVEAARPMVYTTTFLLLSVVLVLNLTAIVVRNRLRKRYAITSF